MPDLATAANVEWTDQDGHACNIAVRLTPGSRPAVGVNRDVVGIVETCSPDSEGWFGVYLPRDQALALHDLLGRALAGMYPDDPAGTSTPSQHSGEDA